MATPTTLPATFVAGNVLTAAQMNNLRGAFRILQVVNATNNTQAASSSTTLTDTGLTASITCQSTSSKVLVIVSQNFFKTNQNGTNSISSRLQRNGADILNTDQGTGYTGTLTDLFVSSNYSYLDSPASVSALTYKTVFANAGGNNAAVNFNKNIYGTPTSTITLMEISA